MLLDHARLREERAAPGARDQEYFVRIEGFWGAKLGDLWVSASASASAATEAATVGNAHERIHLPVTVPLPTPDLSKSDSNK